MKKSALLAVLLLIGVGLSGCPVYDSNDAGCFDDLDCPSGSWCDGDTGTCVVPTGSPSGAKCDEPDDCGGNETCARSGTCTSGDCHFESVGCVRGFECSGESGRWECVAEGSGSSDGGAPSSSNGGAPSSANGGAPSSSNGGAPAAEAGAPASAGESSGGASSD
jgi:hypothetical protein